ncbi:metalloregulator ArsR/SmtB family transcription factor [Motilimonas cestriensis]|uniref:Metalloregulator ArsR/SmtB family transcription factor n=1 Tax=Motilimonas cestriensis TaxID=2742685 RepID=A0ABS8WEL2_9GAMM|nr:metalloregulator ArsR/SmtB family transcription factor [Motilimonas cestriensis]MCE2595999.1 metalloregulator ArsR/SmtB family transcription factor [Motilimonas cestriensis]
MSPIRFYKCLADETRLRCLLLIQSEQELCVCELMEALNESQPKISRHLAQLRNAGLLADRRQGQWVFYRINQTLPLWMQQVLYETLNNNQAYIFEHQQRLQQMGGRPERAKSCCEKWSSPISALTKEY